MAVNFFLVSRLKFGILHEVCWLLNSIWSEIYGVLGAVPLSD